MNSLKELNILLHRVQSYGIVKRESGCRVPRWKPHFNSTSDIWLPVASTADQEPLGPT